MRKSLSIVRNLPRSPTFRPARQTAEPMSTAKTSHIDRTAAEPRDPSLHKVIISCVKDVTPSIRIVRLSIPNGQKIRFLPGQWLDVHVPQVTKPGGFTITSTPLAAESPSPFTITPVGPSSLPYVELAIQQSPTNPAAQHLHLPTHIILDTPVDIRVGGSFTFPPTSASSPKSIIDLRKIKRILFVAGGVGINPLISMLRYLAEVGVEGREKRGWRIEVVFLYSFRREKGGVKALFEDDLRNIFQMGQVTGRLVLFRTGGDAGAEEELGETFGKSVQIKYRRIGRDDILNALGPVEERRQTLCYVCGVPTMTDELVEMIGGSEGMNSSHVLSERWW